MAYEFNPSPIDYSPNSLAGNVPLPAPVSVPKPMYEKGEIIRASIERTDDFSQAGERYRSLSDAEKENLYDNIAVELVTCKRDIIQRVLGYFEKADKNFAQGVKRTMEKYK